LKKTGEREKGKGERDGSSIEGEFEVRESKVRLGISSCLLGHKVRYDGAHKLDRYLANTLVEYVDFVPVCPEVECGFPVPRESLRLVGDPESPRPCACAGSTPASGTT
jgi:hypothetical protein